MSINAHIKDNTIKLHFDKNEFYKFSEVEYILGEELLNFVWLSEDYIRQGYEKLLEMHSCKEAFSDDITEYMEFGRKVDEVADAIGKEYVYLHFYTKSLLWFMCDYPSTRYDDATNQDMIDRFIKNGMPYLSGVLKYSSLYFNEEIHEMHSIYSQLCECAKSKDTSQEHYISVFELAVELILLEIKAQKLLFKEELEATLMIDDNNDMTSLQRLLYLNYYRDDAIYFEGSFKTVLMQFPVIDAKTDDKDEVRESIIEKQSTYVLMHPIEHLGDMIKLETYHMLANNTVIKKCKYCGHYFIPKIRTSSDYCSRIKEGETQPCDKIGPKRVYDLKTKNDPITKAHHKAYNRMRSKLRTNRISQSDFCDWSDTATSMREDCRDGKISFDAYQQWLDGDKA